MTSKDQIVGWLIALALVVMIGLVVYNLHLLDRRVFWANRAAFNAWEEVQELNARVEALELELAGVRDEAQ